MLRKIAVLGLVVLLAGGGLVAFRSTSSPPAPPRLSGALGSLTHWARPRTYPGTVLPARGLADAFAQVRADRRRTLPVPPWTALGPHNFGGRTLALALNPQNPRTVYAGSASGGLWRSYTSGVGAAAWQRVTTGHPALAVSSIAIDPTDSNVIYIGTGEIYSHDDTDGGITVRYARGSYGLGILKTVDGGASWTASLDWAEAQQRGIWAIRINPRNPRTVWAGTTEGTYKSGNGGQTWTRVHATIMVTDLVIDPGDTSRVIVACGNFGSPGTGLYRTLDGGANWAQLSQPGTLPPSWFGKAQLAVTPAAPGTIFVSIGNGDYQPNFTRLLRSTNGGTTWTLRSSTDYSAWQGWFAHDVAVSPTDANRVVACGIDIWTSATGGANLVQRSDWTQWYFGQTPPGGPEGPPNYSHADHHDVVFDPTNPDHIYFANDGGVFRSVDGGATFAGCNGGYQTQQFYAGFSSSPTDPDLALGGLQDNATAIFRGQTAWHRAVGGDGAWTGIDPLDNQVLYASAQYLQMFVTTDGGQAWWPISPSSSYVGATGFISPFALGDGAAGHEVVYAAGTKVARSLDRGSSWSPTSGQTLDGNPALSLCVSPLDPNVVYVTTAPVNSRGRCFRTDDGGAHWQNVTGILPDRYLVGLAIDPTDDRVAYVTLSGFGTPHVYRTGNGGQSWQDIGGGLPDVPTSAVVVDPLFPSYVYVGNDLGVFVTTDGGASWHAYADGLPEAVMVMDLAVSPPNRRLRAATHGNGVYERALLADVVAVEEPATPGRQPQFATNLPNPFNPRTTIRYLVAAAGPTRLRILDARGRLVRTLIDQPAPSGWHDATWDGRDGEGRDAPSGVYLAQLEAPGGAATQRLTLVR